MNLIVVGRRRSTAAGRRRCGSNALPTAGSWVVRTSESRCDEPQFHWLYARAEELDVPVLLHPAKPMTTEQVKP